MNIKIVHTNSGELVDALIKDGGKVRLPSFHEGWRFNFEKHSKRKGCQTYILVSEKNPAVIEGCLIFQLTNGIEPYMAYIEIAPHNRGNERIHDRVAGCLIAFACRLSFIHGKDVYKGWLAFDVLEESEEDEQKLIMTYVKNYGAIRWGQTTLVIAPEKGEQLIEKYLVQ